MWNVAVYNMYGTCTHFPERLENGEAKISKRPEEGDREGCWQQLAENDASLESLHLKADGWRWETEGVGAAAILHFYLRQ